jgi:Fe2+ transport system protein FeoA
MDSTPHNPACSLLGCACLPLSTLRRGDRVVVRHLEGKDTQRLRELGFIESTEIKLVCVGSAVIAQLHGSKICLSRRMAEEILVVPV